jgi:hypothetical protein
MRTILAAVAMGLILAACGTTGGLNGSAPTPTPSGAPFPSFSPGANFDVTVTEKDHAASLRVGQRLLVVLHANANMTNWTHPTSSDAGLLRPVVDVAASAPLGVTVAAFQALAPGNVEVSAFAGPQCAAGQACPMYAILYSLQVTITA